MPPPASVLIPTRGRTSYLEVALASIAPQASEAGADVLVIDDSGPSRAARSVAARFGVRYAAHPRALGLNAARNMGVASSEGELVVFVDDDIRAGPGWLAALIAAARENLGVNVFTGPITPSLEGPSPRTCGREAPPITSLDLGPRDVFTRYAWGANMAIRRSAIERVGPFDVSLVAGGDEEEWQDRLLAATPHGPGIGVAGSGGPGEGRNRAEAGDGPALYVAAAAVEHRREGQDARLGALARTARARGSAARRLDARRGRAPSLARELMTLVACAGHVLRRRCPAGLTMVAHSSGRLQEGLRERAGKLVRPDGHGGGVRSSTLCARRGGSSAVDRSASDAENGRRQDDDFLSGTSGTVGGRDAWRRGIEDELVNTWEIASGRRLRLKLAARLDPPLRRVLVLGVERPERRALADAMHKELKGSRHDVELHTCPPEERGKFENLNRLLAEHPPERHDWLLVVDDDVNLSRGFLDRLLFLCERFSLMIAQPAHRSTSHAAWPHTRRRAGSVVREVRFIEIGPVTAFARATFPALLPFPELRMGWGLDAHWAALAQHHAWRCGVIDAVSIRHSAAPAATTYSREAAIAEARAFLAERPYLGGEDARRTLTTHRHW